MKKILSVIALFLTLIMSIMSLTAPLIAYANEDYGVDPAINREKRIVRVGFSTTPYISEIKDGKRVGVIPDYLKEIAKYAGWEIEYVDCSLEDSLGMLESGEIHLIGNLRKNEATEKAYDFPEHESGIIYTTIISKNSRGDLIANDYQSISGVTVALNKNAKNKNEPVFEFFRKNGIQFTPVYFETNNECQEAVQRGEVDVKVNTSVYLKSDEKILARFYPTRSYFAVKKNNHELLRELNLALEKIQSFEPNFSEKLYVKYFESDGIYDFSQSELEYIEGRKIVKAVLVRDVSPYTFYDKNGKEERGIFLDYLKEIENRSGLSVDIVYVDTFNEAMELILKGEVELFLGVFNSDNVSSVYNLNRSVTCLSMQSVFVSKGKVDVNNLAGKKGAAVYGNRDILEGFGEIEYVFFESPEQCIDAVESGDVDIAVVSYLAWESYFRRKGSRLMSASAILNSEYFSSFIYSKNTSVTLISLMDKVILSIPEATLSTILLNNAADAREINLVSYFIANPLQSIMIIFIAFVMLIAIFLLISRIKIESSKQTALMGRAYRMFGELTDEYLLEYDFKEKAMQLPQKFCEMTGAPLSFKASDRFMGIEDVYEFFAKENVEEFGALEFICPLKNGGNEWFKADCGVLFDNNKPIRGYGKIVSTHIERMEKLELERRANTDNLTGLYNKNYCEKSIREHIVSEENVGKIAIVMLDVDNFKTINDTLGHLGGDEVLLMVAKRIKKIGLLSECSRFGGDEFVIFFKFVKDEEKIKEVLNQLVLDLNVTFIYKETVCELSISLGAVIAKAHEKDYTRLVEAADVALYEAKKKGKSMAVIKSLKDI